MNIHLVGPFPPPFGGVSVHVMRLRRRLLEAGHQCAVWGIHDDPKERLFELGAWRRGLRKLRLVEDDAIFHFHASHLVAGLLAPTRSRVLFSVHNERIHQTLTGGRFPRQWLVRKITARNFRRVRRLVAVSEQAKERLVRFGFDGSTISVINAYLAPSREEAANPDNVEEMRAFRRRFDIVATANAGVLRFFEGEDLYGIDMCLDMIARIGKDHPGFGLVLALPGAEGTEYLATLQARAEELGVSTRILWLLRPGAYHPILQECDMFLRPTNTEGFSISVAESFEFGLPVVASDAVPRPEGCLVFRNRNVDDFVAKVGQAIREMAMWSKRSLAAREPDHFQQLLRVYESLVGTTDNPTPAGNHGAPSAVDPNRDRA